MKLSLELIIKQLLISLSHFIGNENNAIIILKVLIRKQYAVNSLT